MIVDPGKFKSVSECMGSIYKAEGVAGFWRGNSINVMRIAPQGAIGFFAKVRGGGGRRQTEAPRGIAAARPAQPTHASHSCASSGLAAAAPAAASPPAAAAPPAAASCMEL